MTPLQHTPRSAASASYARELARIPLGTLAHVTAWVRHLGWHDLAELLERHRALLEAGIDLHFARIDDMRERETAELPAREGKGAP